MEWVHRPDRATLNSRRRMPHIEIVNNLLRIPSIQCGSMGDVVKIAVFAIDINLRRGVHDAKREFLQRPLPDGDYGISCRTR